MYLIIAEALNEINQGANEEAVIAINAVRNRAGLTTAVPTDYKGFKKAVLNEYRHEFVMEGHRWFDLIQDVYTARICVYHKGCQTGIYS